MMTNEVVPGTGESGCKENDNSIMIASKPMQIFEAAKQHWLFQTDTDSLKEVERLLRNAVAAAEEEEDSEAIYFIKDQLALLLAQKEGGCEEASKIMREDLGMFARLSKSVLRYTEDDDEEAGTRKTRLPEEERESPKCRVFDDALAPSLLAKLQKVFCSPSADYWTHHAYSVYPPSPYFSYVVPIRTLGELEGPIKSLLDVILQAAGSYCCANEAKYAEIWAHNRPHASGHQLHFDSDNEGRGGVRNPLVSSITYLTEGCGGPSLVTDQTLSSRKLAENGWLAFPRENRIVIFDGRVLHGVIPGRGYRPASKRRVTIMIALWRDIRTRKGGENGEPAHGAARPFPGFEVDGSKVVDNMPSKWSEALLRTRRGSRKRKSADTTTTTTTTSSGGSYDDDGATVGRTGVKVPAVESDKPWPCGALRKTRPQSLSGVWTDFDDRPLGAFMPHYDQVFQGF